MLTLPFCTQGGIGLWLATLDGLRFIILPLLFFWLWWGLTRHLGYSGIAIDYWSGTSAIPLVNLWS